MDHSLSLDIFYVLKTNQLSLTYIYFTFVIFNWISVASKWAILHLTKFLIQIYIYFINKLFKFSFVNKKFYIRSIFIQFNNKQKITIQFMPIKSQYNINQPNKTDHIVCRLLSTTFIRIRPSCIIYDILTHSCWIISIHIEKYTSIDVKHNNKTKTRAVPLRKCNWLDHFLSV